MAKTQAISGPNKLPGNRATKATTEMARKPNTGTDCRISIEGIMICSARRLFAAHVPKIKVHIKEKNSAINIRNTVRKA